MTDMDVKTGRLRVEGRAFARVVARFNDVVTSKLLEAAVDTLSPLGVAEADMAVVWVPGAVESPMAAGHLARSGTYPAVLCRRTLTPGQPPHFEYAAGQCASGIAAVARATGVPVIMGV